MDDRSERTARETVYCTITSLGYLPRALALARSVAEHEPFRRMVILIFDVIDESKLPALDGIEIRSWNYLRLPLREYLQMAAYYEAYELATAIKPLFLARLLEEFGGIVYLDSDTQIFSPLEELEPLLESNAIVLTPHIVTATAEPTWLEVTLLRYGAYNLGFGAFNQGAVPFLEWWWSRTRLHGFAQWYKGMWCDQKWVDLGASMFETQLLLHPGYNVAWWNAYGRPLRLREDQAIEVGSECLALRMVHFSNFLPQDPSYLVTRSEECGPISEPTRQALMHLATDYAADIAAAHLEVGVDSRYLFDRDTTGRLLTSGERRAYRDAIEAPEGTSLPLPFLSEETASYERWRRSTRLKRLSLAATEAVSPPAQERLLAKARALVPGHLSAGMGGQASQKR